MTGDGTGTAPSDGPGHGTRMARRIAGNGSLSGGRYGDETTHTRFIGLKVLNAQGRGDGLFKALNLVADSFSGWACYLL